MWKNKPKQTISKGPEKIGFTLKPRPGQRILIHPPEVWHFDRLWQHHWCFYHAICCWLVPWSSTFGFQQIVGAWPLTNSSNLWKTCAQPGWERSCRETLGKNITPANWYLQPAQTCSAVRCPIFVQKPWQMDADGMESAVSSPPVPSASHESGCHGPCT